MDVLDDDEMLLIINPSTYIIVDSLPRPASDIQAMTLLDRYTWQGLLGPIHQIKVQIVWPHLIVYNVYGILVMSTDDGDVYRIEGNWEKVMAERPGRPMAM